MNLIPLLFVSTVAFSLYGQAGDSATVAAPVRKNLKYYFSRDTTNINGKGVRLDFQLDFRNSFIRDFPIDIYGGNFGIIFRRKFRIGAGYYVISQRFADHLMGLRLKNGSPYVDKKGVPIPISKLTGKEPYTPASQSLAINYGCINFTYLFYSSRIVDLYIPVEIGYGTFSEKLIDPLGYDFANLPKSPVPSTGSFWPGQVGVMSVTKIHRWFYFLSAIGYRKTLHQSFESQSEFTNFESEFESYYYRLGIQVQIGTLWKTIVRKPRPETINPNKE